MIKIHNLIFLLLLVCSASADIATAQQMPGNELKTPWTDKVDANAPWPEYPRPQLQRDKWTNLNGRWDYALQPRGVENAPASYDGKILVPFPIESALSGVQRKVDVNQRLWYHRNFTLPDVPTGQRLLIHFGAVDWQAEVFINGKSVGRHEGGYDPFTFDITDSIKPGAQQQEVIVAVWDPADNGPQPRGKQVTKPNSIWYTSVTGIWQTVWLEAVPETYISGIRQTPDIDQKTLAITARVENFKNGDILQVSAWDGNRKVAEQQVSGQKAVLRLNNPRLWSPETPFLYDLRLAVVRQGKIIDEAKGYFAMRQVSISPGSDGVQRMLINHRAIFQYGPLDQGWWPDGLYTAPTDEAMRFDIEKMKAMGFNMVRKHVKVEPARWYYDCDRLGLMVWQDMPSGDLGNRWNSRPGVIGYGDDKARTAESEKIYRTEWKAIIDATYNFPSMIVWVPFNEAWGQFKTDEIAGWTRTYDPTRLVDSASGGNFTESGQMIDLHNYPEPAMPRADLFGRKRAIVLGEFGGLGLPIKEHLWQADKNWGYREYKDPSELEAQYANLLTKLKPLIKQGLSAAVYTQLTDVEGEVNGLMTYDRQVTKIPVEKIAALHRSLFDQPEDLKRQARERSKKR